MSETGGVESGGRFVASMASVSIGEDSDNKGSMWDLEQKLDQPMDEEAGMIKNMYREKVRCNLLLRRYHFFFHFTSFPL